MKNYLDWNPREFCRLVGIVTSGSKASIVPVRIAREDIGFVRDEMLVIIDDFEEGRRYLGVFKGSIKKDLALDASALPTSFDPEKTHMYSAPSMISYVELIGEISRSGVELSFSIPRPGSYVYTVVDGERLQKILGIKEGLKIGIHKFSSMEILLDPRALSYHIAILGATGSGKSRLAKCIVEEVLRTTDHSIVVFDHTGIDYSDRSRWGTEVEVVDASRIVLEPDVIAQMIVENASITGYIEEYVYGAVVDYIRRKIAEVVSPQYNGKRTPSSTKVHDEDLGALLTLFKDFARKDLFTWDFNEFLKVLENSVQELGGQARTARKLKLLIASRLGKKFFDEYLNNRSIVIEDIVDKVLSGGRRLIVVDLSTEVEYTAKRGIVYQFMKSVWDRIWSRREAVGRKIVTVIDEAHNYTCIHGCEPAKSIIARTAREGRKWGFGVILVSQRVIDLAPEIRGNINTVFFSRLQSSGDYVELRNWLEGIQYLEYTLPMLASREFYFVGFGNPLRKPLLIRVRDVR